MCVCTRVSVESNEVRDSIDPTVRSDKQAKDGKEIAQDREAKKRQSLERMCPPLKVLPGSSRPCP